MADLNYDPSPLFDLLPSFWRDSFEDRDKLSAIYEAYLRLADADYAAIFTADDNKDTSTLRPTRYMPLQYQEMDDWEILQAKHSHCYFQTDWPIPIRGKYTVYLPDKALGRTNLIFADKVYLPPFLYSTRQDWWVDSDQVVRGTVIDFDEARVLRYFTETYGDPNLCYTNSATTGFVSFLNLRVFGFDPRQILTVDADSATREYTFGSDYDLTAGNIQLEFADVSRQIRIQRRDGGDYTLYIPTSLASNSRGLLELDDGTFQQINFAPTVQVSLGVRTIAKVLLHVDFDLESDLTLSGKQVTLGKGAFNAGTEVIVRAAGQTSTTLLPKAAQRITTDCGTLTDSAQVLYFGTNLAGFRKEAATPEIDQYGASVIRDQRIVFDRPLNKGVSFTVTVPKKEEHTHVYDTFTLDDHIDPGEYWEESSPTFNGQFKLSAPAREASMIVYANGRMLLPDQFSYDASRQYLLTIDLVPETASVYYEAPRTDVAHVHKMDKIVRGPGDAPKEYPLKHPALTTVSALVLGGNLPAPATLSQDSVRFAETPEENKLYTVLYTSFGRNYRHHIPYALEEEWNYKGRLKSAATLQDGIETPTTVLGPDDFDLIEDNGKLYVYTDTQIHEGWWTDVEFDDKALQNIWGNLLGLKGESTPQFARAVGAILAAARSSSSPESIENFGSMLLGSPTTGQPGYYGGVNEYDNTLTMLPAIPGDTAETLVLVPGAKMRAPQQGCVPRNYAVQNLVQYVDLNKETLTWLPAVAEALSDSFKAAERLDRTTTSAVTSVPYSYQFEEEILTDYSINFNNEGIVAGDVLLAKFGTINLNSEFGTPLESTFAVIKQRLGPHTLRVALPRQQYVSSGYGENGYGEYGYGQGASVNTAFVTSYTVWGRRKSTLDVGAKLDQFDPNALRRIQNVLAPFNFGVKLNWAQMTDTFSIESLGRMLDVAKPADTNAIVFAEAFENALSEVSGGVFQEEGDPVLLFPPDTFAATESFIGLSSVVEEVGSYAALYTAGCPVYGAFVRAVTRRPDDKATEGEYYLVGAAPDGTSDFSNTYLGGQGLANMLLRVQSDGSYVATSSLGSRPMRGIRTGTSTATGPDLNIAGDATVMPSFTVNLWVRFNWENVVANTNYDVFSLGSSTVYMRSSATNNTFQLRATNQQPGFINGGYDIVPGQDYLVTYVYERIPDANRLELYVNGVSIAERVSTLPDTPQTVPFILAGGVAVPADMTVFALDARTGAMSEADIQAYHDEQTLPPIGMTPSGGPLAFNNAFTTLMPHVHDSSALLSDYSGLGNHLDITGTDYTMTTGDLVTELQQPGDNHIVELYEVTENGLGTQPVPRASVYDPVFDYTNEGYVFGSTGKLRAGSGIVDNTQTTLQRDGATFVVPDIAYSLTLNNTWLRIFPNVVVPSASLGYDDSAPYTGFPVV